MPWVTVRRCLTLQDAEMTRMTLGSCGIEATIPDAASAGVAPHLFLTKPGVRVQVREEDEAEAREILAASGNQGADAPGEQDEGGQAQGD